MAAKLAEIRNLQIVTKLQYLQAILHTLTIIQ